MPKWTRSACLIAVWLSVSLDPGLAVEGGQTPAFERARMWATNVCGVCHLFPGPDLLDHSTWSNRIMPLMRIRMDVAALENSPSPDARALMEQWNAIWNDYYLVTAPERAPPQDPRPPIVPDLELFNVEDPHYAPTNGYATMVQIDTDTHQVYIGNAITKSLDVLDAHGQLMASTHVDSTVTHLLKVPQGWLGTQIGFVPPNDLPLGAVTLYRRKGNEFEKQCDLISRLVRPVHTAVGDLLGDGRKELVVSIFGNVSGKLAWYSSNGPCSYLEHSIVDRPGALVSRIVDIDQDGKPDLVV